MKGYFIIHYGEDGTSVEQVDKNELLDRIKEQYYGEVGFKNEIGDDSDTNYWGGDLLIIKGEIVVPNSVEVTTKYDID